MQKRTQLGHSVPFHIFKRTEFHSWMTSTFGVVLFLTYLLAFKCHLGGVCAPTYRKCTFSPTFPTHSFLGWEDRKYTHIRICITPHPMRVWGIIGWCGWEWGVEGRAVPRQATGTAWHCSATHPKPAIQECYVFSQDDGKKLTWYELKTWFMTPPFLGSARFLSLMYRIDIKVPV